MCVLDYWWMNEQGTTQQPSLGMRAGGWHTALLLGLALVLCLQPFICLLHCAQMEQFHQQTAQQYHLLCSMGAHGTGEQIAGTPIPSGAISGAAETLVPAYWPGVVSTWAVALGVLAVVLRLVPHMLDRPAAFAAVPATPPPR